jgi:hypothetical protein
LNNILAVHHRPGHPRTVSVQARPQLSDRLQKGEVSGIEVAHRVDIIVTFSIHIDRYAAAVFGDTEPRRDSQDSGAHSKFFAASRFEDAAANV